MCVLPISVNKACYYMHSVEINNQGTSTHVTFSHCMTA